MSRFISALVLILLVCGSSQGLTLGGRLTSSLYTYEAQQTDTTTTAYGRVHQGVRLDLGALGLRALSLHTYVQGTTDLSQEADNDPRLRLYYAYLKWQRKGYKVQLGRQRIYAGVGYGSIDGAQGKLQWADFDLLLYGGTLVPLDKTTALGTWSEGHLWGARISTKRFFDTAIALSFANREREQQAYGTPGRYSGVTVIPSAVVRRLVGVDLSRRLARGHSLYGRLDYDLLDKAVRHSEFSGRYVFSPRLSAQVEWFRRAPTLFYNSIFSVFPSQTYQEIGGRLYFRLNGAIQLTGNFATVLYDEDSAQRIGLVVSMGQHYSLGYYRSMGYAQASDGLVGNVYYPLTAKLLVKGELDLAAYERYSEADERDELVAGALGLSYRPGRRTFVELGLQGLRNPLFSADTRLFLRGSWRFFKGEK